MSHPPSSPFPSRTDAAALPLRALARVLANEREGAGAGAASHRLRVQWPGFAGFAPGQFAMVSPGAIGSAERCDPLLPRPMAIYRAEPGAGGGEVEILYKVHGRGTALLADARPGERVRVVGPLGRPFPLPAAGQAALLVGGGTGIASLYELASRARAASGARVAVLLGARSAGDLMAVADFEALGVDVRIATEDGSAGARGLVTALLDAALAEDTARGALVYACGPTPMMRAAADVAAAHGCGCIVSLENRMACGVGVCLGCAAPVRAGGYALVCRRGPVFDADDVAWDGLP